MSERELLEALRPFALYAEQMSKAWGQRDDCVFYGIKRPGAHQITYGDFRKAAKVCREMSTPPRGEVSYQWFDEHGEPIPGETGSSLKIRSGLTGRETVRMSVAYKCPACKEMFTDGGTCSRGGCPMGGDF